MRLNRLVAGRSGLSRRQADEAITAGRVKVGGQPGTLGQDVGPADPVTLDGEFLPSQPLAYVVLNKPVGYVCSRRRQGSPTIYELLPDKWQQLQSVGRLDKDSSGLLLLTNDGLLAEKLSHPRYAKLKTYQVRLDKPLAAEAVARLSRGIKLRDGLSQLQLGGSDKSWTVGLTEGRNRQIRRTFKALGYEVVALNRTAFGSLELGNLAAGKCREVSSGEVA